MRETYRRLRRHGRTYPGRVLRGRLDRLFFRIGRESLLAVFRSVGLTRGARVSVHASLSRLGHLTGGPGMIIEALMETVGEEGCILMPSFPMTGSMESWIERGETYDVRRTPSRVGLLTEIFRRRDDVLRSLHPTNPLAAWGSPAESFLRDHERSRTPYGPETPYGRLADDPQAFILMLETHIHSFLHHLQHRVDFPNLYLGGEREVPYRDAAGRLGSLRTRVMRPRVPYFVAVPGIRGPHPDWAILHDFALMFPRRRERAARKLGYRFEGYPRLHDRRADLERVGVLRTARLGRGEIGLLRIRGFLDRVEPELRELIEQFRASYDPDAIASLRLPYS